MKTPISTSTEMEDGVDVSQERAIKRRRTQKQTRRSPLLFRRSQRALKSYSKFKTRCPVMNDPDDFGEGPSSVVKARVSIKQSASKTRRKVPVPRSIDLQRRNSFTKGFDLKVPADKGLAGQLLRVKLVHFMCHEHFEIYFGPHVNFVSGKNGSGKSAILQAIQVCLGSKAFETGRGKNIAEFIKTGKSYSKISVSIWNVGESAYRSDIYGNVITIERAINQGHNRYSLIDEHGYCISSKRADLDRIIESFDILIRNPMVVLTQGAASTFLRGKKLPEDLFCLYMKATQFDETAEELGRSLEQIQNQKRHIETASSHIEEMKVERNETVERLARAREERQATLYLHHAENCKPYLQIDEESVSLKEKLAAFQEAQADFDACSAQFKEKTEEMEKARNDRLEFNEDSQAAAMRRTLSLLKTQETDLKDQKRTAERMCKEPKKKIESIQSQIADLKERKKEKESNVETLKNDDGEETAKEDFQKQVSEIEQRLEALQIEADQVRERRNAVAQQLEKQEKFVRSLTDSCNHCRSEVERCKINLDQIQMSQKDPIMMFGGHIVKKLLEAIAKNKNKFDREPIGPIGRYLSLNEERWSIAIEYAIGRLLNSFIVHSFEDERRLRIIVFPFTRPPHDIHVYERPPQRTILKTVTIAETEFPHIIRNVLIDYGSAESIVLCPSEEEAFRIIRSSSENFRPAHVRLPTGRKVYKRRNFEASVHDGRKLQPRLVRDIPRRMRECEEHHKNAVEKFRKEKVESENAMKEQSELEKKLEDIEAEALRIEQNRQTVTDELHALKRRGPLLPVYATFDLEGLQDDIKKIDDEIARLYPQIDEAEKDLEYRKEQVAIVEQRIAENKRELETKKVEAEQLSSQMNALTERYEKANSEFKKAELALTSKRNALHEIRTEVESRKATMDALKTKAAEKCAEEEANESMQFLKDWFSNTNPSTILTTARLDAWIVDLKRKIRNFCLHCNDNIDELMEIDEDISTKIRNQERNLQNMIAINEESEAGQKKRVAIYKESQKKMDNVINEHFTKYMKKRGHHGTLKSSHKDKRMDIRIKLSGHIETVRDMASLSGGERSFTTVCLLLALASIVKSPFHCMDEFDVFTDAMTKHCAIQALLETAATEKTHSQFIFFSPQDVGTVEDVRLTINKHYENVPDGPRIPSDFIRIYHMAAPEREAL